MSRMRSPSLVGHFKTLFGLGTLWGLARASLRKLSSRSVTRRRSRKSWRARADGARHIAVAGSTIRTPWTTPSRPCS